MQDVLPDAWGSGGRPPPAAPRPRRGRGPRANPKVRLGLGDVLATSGRVLLRRLVPFLVLGLVVELPRALYALGRLASWRAGAPSRDFFQASGPWMPLTLDFLGVVVLQCVIAYGVYAHLSGRRGGFTTALKGLRSFFSVVVIGILVWALVAVCFVSLVAVGIFFTGGDPSAVVVLVVFLVGAVAVAGILLCTFFLAPQAAIVERRGPFAAMARSAWLTRGARWPLFALHLLLYVAVGIVLHLLVRRPAAPLREVLSPEALLLLGSAFGVVQSVFVAIVAAVAYQRLRTGKEGTPIDDIVEVFA